jgi:hypothetical protein
MEILFMIFFFGVAISLVVLKGLFVSQEYANRAKRVKDARRQTAPTDASKD